jgi:hypothetical protein
MWGAIHFSQLALMLGSGDTSLCWSFGNALLTKKYVIHVNYSAVSRQHQKVYLVCVFMYDILCNIFVLFMCLDVSDAVHLSCRQKTAWCVDYDEISRKTLQNQPGELSENVPYNPTVHSMRGKRVRHLWLCQWEVVSWYPAGHTKKGEYSLHWTPRDTLRAKVS